MFLYFLQRMEWLGGGNQEFMMYLWTTYKNNKNQNSNFYDDYLKLLFFGALCNKYTYQENLPEEINNFYMQAPYLNGGLFNETDLDKLGFIISDHVFEDKELIAVKFEEEEREKIKNTLKTLTVLDPAVGSASFLVGILEILTTLLEHLAREEGQEVTPQFHYELKKEIVEQSLYGVDVLSWAIQVAQLRIWLQLIIDTPDELKESQEPILPSLSYKLRVGDSLVQQEIGEYKFPLELRKDYLADWIYKNLNKLKGLKIEHYENKIGKSVVDDVEREFFINILLNQRDYLEKEVRKKEQKTEQDSLLPTSKKFEISNNTLNKEIIENLKSKIAEINKVHNSIQNKKDLPFVWGIGFAEIFSGKKEGFDIVIGNPPYVRQEKIANPLQDNPTLEQKREYKKKLLEFVQHYWSKGVNVQMRADYYVYFYLIGLALLNSKGSFCFITSNSWLDVKFGKDLQKFLLKNVKIKKIYDNKAKRTFAAASVNTIISSFSSKVLEEEAFQNKARFVMFKKPFEEVLFEENIWAIDHTLSRVTTEDYCMRIFKQEEIFKDGSEKIKIDKVKWDKTVLDYHYSGNRWGGKYLRAPDIFFSVIEKGKGKLVRLGDIAEVRRGFTTGCNEFFYLPSKHFDIKKEGRFYNYIKWGETQSFHKITSVKNRKYWYDVGTKSIPHGIILRRIGERMPVFYGNGVLEDCCLFGIIFKNQNNILGNITLLNSTWNRLELEVNTRQLTGAQAVADTNVYIVKDMRILDLNSLSDNKQKELLRVSDSLFNRESFSIFKELGIISKQQIRFQKPNPLPDRKALDDIVFGILGLTQEERDEAYWAVCELVKNRIEKARSV